MVRRSGVLAALAPLAAVLLAGPVAAQTTPSHAEAKKAAREAAASWLALVDDDQFGESWDAAAGVLQQRIRREEWVRQARQLRDTTKALTTRRLATTQYRDSLRRAPADGPFVLLKYRSTFAAGRFEELLLTVRQDKAWTVAGYQVTPLRADSARFSGSTRP
jgi:hypothetical protein